ncbi:hypothetical protein J8I87_12890 [Paraburkholderia sp. LEh10]|uniref:hypothetical protein n=1 Tax=Paraburkholderia sp. LEh10 TaxID=2821353 RepID=UPI001AE9ABF3|nr:hypothetical protein [Paraburkholderia sp. LEh10]MBP0590598.1 hypothetical protein [Paraburkholderia sp. LEh10]
MSGNEAQKAGTHGCVAEALHPSRIKAFAQADYDVAPRSERSGISLALKSDKRCVTTTAWSRQSHRRKQMPYLIGWLLGVPLIVLVILYLIFH